MSKILKEILSANHKYAETFGDKATPGTPSGSALRDTHLYGRAA
jgi:hypothetical protein